MSLERLQKILSRAGVSSRRHAEALITAGKVRVNGQVVRELGTKADPTVDRISVDDRLLGTPKKKFHYYAYYKPRGVLVTKQDDFGRTTLFHGLDLPPEVNSVGRLDKDSEGLLLLTDDGEFLQRYTHPSFEIPKIYLVQLSRRLADAEKRQLMAGVVLDEKKVRAVALRRAPASSSKGEGIWIEMELREGIKREIRRMMELFGVKVLRLIRVRHGSVRLGELQEGELREIKKRPSI